MLSALNYITIIDLYIVKSHFDNTHGSGVAGAGGGCFHDGCVGVSGI